MASILSPRARIIVYCLIAALNVQHQDKRFFLQEFLLAHGRLRTTSTAAPVCGGSFCFTEAVFPQLAETQARLPCGTYVEKLQIH